jgi:aspartyl-tRNA(Asn)/glutamyl-tRNA(Gln) amidotransferase subunit B
MSKTNLDKNKYKPTIGLEIHIELKTETKMFCSCKNDTNEQRPNINVCPICLGHPGVLPTINKKAIELVAQVGLALGGKISKQAQFDRKSYFYPDLPKGYQISQYDNPLVKGGELAGVRLTRIHLEEDAGRLAHIEGDSLVDFNRAGLPLMELVTEPDINSGEKAVEFAKELQLVMRYLNASNADMEKGEMRIEANISVAKEGAKKLGTKVEVKNINSFKAVRESIDYETKRQIELIDRGEKVIQETRGSVLGAIKTVSQRVKEGAEDYRYMPEPDLPEISLNIKDSIDIDALKLALPELPNAKRKRFIKEFGLREDQVEVLIGDIKLSEYFEDAVSELLILVEDKEKKQALQLLVNYITSDVVGIMKDRKIWIDKIKISAEDIAELVYLIYKGELTSRIAKTVLQEMFETGLDPHKIIEEKDVRPSEAPETEGAVAVVIEENPKAVNDFKKGKEIALKFLIGQAMARLRGRGNPELLEKLFRENLSK